MADNTQLNGNTKADTVGGTLLILLLHIESDEVVNTFLLASAGATASFGVSRILQWIFKRLRQ